MDGVGGRGLAGSVDSGFGGMSSESSTVSTRGKVSSGGSVSSQTLTEMTGESRISSSGGS